jgi:outer membrane protein assembly factor BamB
MKFSEKQIKLFRGISLVSGIFTMLIAFTMIFSLLQLKAIDPLNNPSVIAVKEQFDKDPDNREKAEQVRAMDLMARKAYFSSRWQIETGSYLMLAGAVIFILFQRLIAGTEKNLRASGIQKPDINAERIKNRRYLVISAGAVVMVAVISSFVLRADLPSPGQPSGSASKSSVKATAVLEAPGDVNFPFFRGEGGRGLAGGTGYPTQFDGAEGKNIKWKIPLPKNGKSSPVIWEDKLFITGADGAEFEIYCIDKNKGELLWTGSGSDFEGSSAELPEGDEEAGMAVPTPAVCDEGVYAIFGNGNLVAYSLDGKRKWAKNIGVPQHIYGYSASLLIYNNILLVQYDSETKMAIIGFDINTGEQKWETIRPGRPVNASPALGVFNGTVQVIINGSPNVSAYDASNGKELWILPGVKNDVAASPAVNSKYVYIVANYEALYAILPGPAGSTVAWQDNTYTPDVSSPVANEEFLFVADGAGGIACYKTDNKAVVWDSYFSDPFYASPVIADGKVYFIDRAGKMHVVKAQDTYELVAESTLGENVDCTPAFSEKKIYIRGSKNLYCISED